jgi:metal-sulfur cluster biosynthetic enzyme
MNASADEIPDESAVHDALKQVDDPEAGMNIVDLGLIYGVTVGPRQVTIEMTMTTAACPMTDMIADDVRERVAAVSPGGTVVDVQLVWDPPWTPERMSETARQHFGW